MPRKPTTKAGKQRKVGKVMGEFREGSLKSSSGQKVTNRKQAVAIAMSEAGVSRAQKGRPVNNPTGSRMVGEGNGQRKVVP
ncbi:MAG: DUF6496 domain-containing protein [Gammaproteobacteria bacterium]